ncbi:hypothetical protein ASD93_09585 [Microbacterium sp. Root180]|nr:hypothetical protein ASD93_09585 [Microbacterium sp. Root180]
MNTTTTSDRTGILDADLLTYSELRVWLPRRRIARLLDGGQLIRVRKGSYVRSDSAPQLVAAARSGGRLDCISLLRLLGVFVLEPHVAHIQMDRTATRIAARTDAVVRHFRASAVRPLSLAADVVEAAAQACRCQPPRAAIATLDSAWHTGLLNDEGIAAVFGRLPRRYQALRPLLDRRSESGPETLMRLLVRSLGLAVDIQVRIDGVGRVDLVVEGWLIIECDSEAHHADWIARKRDARRDLAAATRGYTTLRPIAEDIMHHPEVVLNAVRGLVAARRGVHSVGSSRATGRKAD